MRTARGWLASLFFGAVLVTGCETSTGEPDGRYGGDASTLGDGSTGRVEGGGRDGGGDGADLGDASAVDGSVADDGGDGGGSCHGGTQVGSFVSLTFSGTAPPVVTPGGTLVAGTYVLTDHTEYGGGGGSGFLSAETWRVIELPVGGGLPTYRVERVVTVYPSDTTSTDAGPTDVRDTTFVSPSTVDGATGYLHGTHSCPASSTMEEDVAYSTDGTTLVLLVTASRSKSYTRVIHDH